MTQSAPPKSCENRSPEALPPGTRRHRSDFDLRHFQQPQLIGGALDADRVAFLFEAYAKLTRLLPADKPRRRGRHAAN